MQAFQPQPCSELLPLGGYGARGPGVRPAPTLLTPQEPQTERNAPQGGGSPAAGAAAPPGWVSFRAPGKWRRRRGRFPRQRERGAEAGAAGGGARPPCGTRQGLRGGSSRGGGQRLLRAGEGQEGDHGPFPGLSPVGGGAQRQGVALRSAPVGALKTELGILGGVPSLQSL